MCKKKVTDDSTGYRCERCDKIFTDAIPSFNFAFRLADFTDSHVFNVLGDAGEAILGRSAIEFYEIQ